MTRDVLEGGLLCCKIRTDHLRRKEMMKKMENGEARSLR